MVQPQLPSCLRQRSVHQWWSCQDHEVHLKQPTDQDSDEAVARQRDCITQASADSGIILSLTASFDQASTAVLADDEPAMFGREEVLRFDEELMSFQWFDTITCKDLRGTTYTRSHW